MASFLQEQEKQARRITVNTEHTSNIYYRDALLIVLRGLGWEVAHGRPAPHHNIVWWDEPIRRVHMLALHPSAQTNRFYAMVRVCRKVCCARLLAYQAQLYPDVYQGIAPVTWWVGSAWPDQLVAHRRHCESLLDKTVVTYIVKPDNGCQGAGIELVRWASCGRWDGMGGAEKSEGWKRKQERKCVCLSYRFEAMRS